MAKCKVIWSHRAKINLFRILDFYAKRNDSPTFSIKLYKRFKEGLLYLAKHPELGIKTDFDSIRGLIIDDFIIYYEVTSTNIIVHTIWDSRQNPKDLKIK